MKITRRQLGMLIKETLEEVENTCWDGYRPGAQSGVKTKKGKKGNRVANCEKINKLEEAIEEGIRYHFTAGVGVDRNIYRPGSTAFFALFREVRRLYNTGQYEPISEEEVELLEELNIGEFALHKGVWVPLDYPIMKGDEQHLNEAEYKGRKVDLNKPIIGGSKGAYVYVKNDKGNIQKVEFGSSMPDAMGKSEAHKKRRKNYGIRHKCSEKDDKTAPGYWSCRATKHFGRSISGWW